jgi:hypothetical protein
VRLHHLLTLVAASLTLFVLAIKLLLELVDQLLVGLLRLDLLPRSVGRIADVDQVASLAVCNRDE